MTYISRLPLITAEIAALMDHAVEATAKNVAENAASRVPVNTGKLKEAIHVKREGIAEFAVIAGDGKDAFYGHLVEHGGNNTPARPFLIPALEDSVPVAQTIGAAALRRL